MYRFIVQDGDAYSKHFIKYNLFSEVKNCTSNNISFTSSNVSNAGVSSIYRAEEPARDTYNAYTHVYRIKDLIDAINTSVIMDGRKKEQYIQMLSSSDSEFNSDNEFVDICHNLGECDVL